MLHPARLYGDEWVRWYGGMRMNHLEQLAVQWHFIEFNDCNARRFGYTVGTNSWQPNQTSETEEADRL